MLTPLWRRSNPQPETEQPPLTQPCLGGGVPRKPTLLFQLLEVTVISAQDLDRAALTAPTYAVVWVHPANKLTTRVDRVGRANPTWNDKFVFRVDDGFLAWETSAVMIQIYGSRRYRQDPLIGTVRLLLSAVKPSASTRFVALQVRRPSCRPQGILNVGVALLDGYIRNMPLYSTVGASAFAYKDIMGMPPQPRKHPAAGRQQREAVGAEGEGSLTRTASVAVEGRGDSEREELQTKLDRWRAELPSTPLGTVGQRRAAAEEGEVNTTERAKRGRKGTRSWSMGALSCFCEAGRHRD